MCRDGLIPKRTECFRAVAECTAWVENLLLGGRTRRAAASLAALRPLRGTWPSAVLSVGPYSNSSTDGGCKNTATPYGA